MYNNHQPIYSIRGDPMCYENKIMSNAAPPARHQAESVCLNVADHDRKDPDSLKRSKFKFRPAHLVNFTVVVVVGLVVGLVEFGYLPQTKGGFYCKDPQISHKYTGDTISNTTLLSVTLLLPITVFVFVEYLSVGTWSKIIFKISWRWFQELLIGSSVMLVFVEVCKVILGETRPHFLHTCLPDAAENCEAGTYISDYECTNMNFSRALVIDSSRSFPSGHAAIGMYTSIFCAAYIQVRLRTDSIGLLAKPFLIAVVLIWGPLCGLSRITDHRHHWWDVLAGVVLGVSGSLYAILILCDRFQNVSSGSRTSRPTQSTTTLLDIKNKDATSVII